MLSSKIVVINEESLAACNEAIVAGRWWIPRNDPVTIENLLEQRSCPFCDAGVPISNRVKDSRDDGGV